MRHQGEVIVFDSLPETAGAGIREKTNHRLISLQVVATAFNVLYLSF